MKTITMIRNGEERFVFKEFETGRFVEHYERWEEDPESPEGAVGEWKTYHTVSTMPRDAVKMFTAKLSIIGFVYC